MSCAVNEVAYFCDAFEDFSSLQVSVSDTETRKPKCTFTAVNAAFSAAQSWWLSFSPQGASHTSGLSPAHTAAVAVDTFRASSRLCCLTREFVMVSKWDAGNHPRCRSDSLVPSTQSEKQRNKEMQNSANEARFDLAGTGERGGSGCLTVSALLMH